MGINGISIIFIVFSFLGVNKAEWLEPHFLNAGTDGVDFSSESAISQKINVREEILCPFNLAIINYEGPGTPTLGVFNFGDNGLLGAKIEQHDNDGQWYIIITSRQDYEDSRQRIYDFSIYIKNDDRINEEHSIFITLQNIFDNAPVIQYSPSPCRAEELQSDFITECIFTVYDVDGMENNKIVMQISGQHNENEIFDFVENKTEVDKIYYNLRIIQELHYEQAAIYNLHVTAFDIAENSGNIIAILQVIDVPNMDPVWVKPLATATFPEKTNQSFSVKAIDGDTGIDKPICYRLEFDIDYSDLISIDEDTGILTVEPIDRDARKQEIFSFFTCAFKCDNITWAIKDTSIFIVQDINDHYPEIEIEPSTVSFLENKYITLPLDKFAVNDIDLGENATYNVMIYQSGDVIYSEAFDLIPNSGYQYSTFRLTITNATLLDYEDEIWREFTLLIQSQEVETPEHSRTEELIIELINWNDELPIFENSLYNISVLETIGPDEILATVLATDRDIDDSVIHEIVGTIPGINIDATTGVIMTIEKDAFDYEKQTTVMLQIKATDTLVTPASNVLHSVFTQLTINVIDVNDETPEMRMPRSPTNITENSIGLTLVTDKIEARDPDTTANLTFVIIWNDTYATKAGQEASHEDYENCFIIEAHPVTRNLVYGYLRVNPDFVAIQDIDYEKYDTIFLSIKVIDNNQEVNSDNSIEMLTVRLNDLNDNPPIFVENTLIDQRRVVEEAEINTLVGTILAIDIDGPGNNVITYQMIPNDNLTQNGLIDINSTNGVMRVISDQIDCDLPEKIYSLHYKIILTDTFHTTEGLIKIDITDINNKKPQVAPSQIPISIYENATTNTEIGKIRATDADRDPPHNTLQFSINYVSANELQNLFEVNTTTGDVIVRLRNNAVLDRDHGTTYHLIPIEVQDNYLGNGPVFQNKTYFNVTLLDVNDNHPQMPETSEFAPTFSENDGKDFEHTDRFVAPDIDEPNTNNSWVAYRIISIKPGSGNTDNVSNFEDLFTIKSYKDVENDYGRLVTRKSLKGYYGNWILEIEAYDHGIPRLSNSSIYNVRVTPYNFNAPKIIYPIQNKSIRLCYSLQEVKKPLYEADCTTHLKPFEAYDPDGEQFGDVSFELSSSNGDDKNFIMQKVDFSKNQSMLYLTQNLPSKIYLVNVRAIDGGGKFSNEITDLKIVFVDTYGNPYFKNTNFSTDFTENVNGTFEQRLISEAEDPKNDGIDNEEDKYKVYYFIDDQYRPEDSAYFKLDKETRILTLRKELDRDDADTRYIQIKATNDINGAIANPNSVNYTLLVTISINDVKDKPPIFDARSYGAGITDQDVRGKPILTIHATDTDLDDPTSYVINKSSIITHGENIEQYKDTIFDLDKNTGVLNLTMPVRSNMAGYFQFSVIAYDTAFPPFSDEVPVKIFIISEVNRVRFVFVNDEATVRANEAFLRETFQRLYEYEFCNIDDIEQIRDDIPSASRQSLGSTRDSVVRTEVRTHFIDNNEAIEAIEIQRKSNDVTFITQLKTTLLMEKNLTLRDVPQATFDDVQQSLESLLTIVLIVVSVLLITLCVVLVVAFVIKIRSMNRQLKAFAPPEFGSTASNLNRIGAPTTNIFSIEGSNPVINNKDINNVLDAYDESDIESGDESDFVGVNNDPTFMMNDDDDDNEKKMPRISQVRNNNIINTLRNSLQSEVSEDYEYETDEKKESNLSASSKFDKDSFRF